MDKVVCSASRRRENNVFLIIALNHSVSVSSFRSPYGGIAYYIAYIGMWRLGSSIGCVLPYAYFDTINSIETNARSLETVLSVRVGAVAQLFLTDIYTHYL